MTSFALMANELREQIVVSAMDTEAGAIDHDSRKTEREETLKRKIQRSRLSQDHTSKALKDLAQREKPHPCRKYRHRHRKELSVSERISVVHGVLVQLLDHGTVACIHRISKTLVSNLVR